MKEGWSMDGYEDKINQRMIGQCMVIKSLVELTGEQLMEDEK
jgi:hypothetical protein